MVIRALAIALRESDNARCSMPSASTAVSPSTCESQGFHSTGTLMQIATADIDPTERIEMG
jgi:hypothetical protein